MRRRNIFAYIDAATLIVLITAAMYLWGYTYYSSLLGEYEVNFFGLSFESYVLKGAEYIVWGIGVVSFTVFLHRLILFMDAESRDIESLSKKLPRTIRRNASKVLAALIASIYLFVFVLAILLMERMESRGRITAHEYVMQRKKIKLITKSEIPLPNQLCLFAYVGGKYIVFDEMDKRDKPQMYIVAEDNLSGVTFPKE
jgi:1,4-dihydroxy-2-naphthoate octaprenyltransferase